MAGQRIRQFLTQTRLHTQLGRMWQDYVPSTRLYQHFQRVWHDRQLRTGIVWWILLSFTVFVLSAVFVVEASLDVDEHVPLSRNGVSKYWLYLTFVLGFFTGALWLILTSWFRDKPKPLYGITGALPHFRRHMRRDWLTAAMVSVVASLLCVTFCFLFMDKLPPHTFWTTALTNPGGFFAFLTGAGTLVGTYIAIQSILEMKYTITSYPQLLDRLVELIRDAGESHFGVIFLAYSPLSGAWQLKHGKNQLKRWLTEERRCIRVVCLTEDDHLRLLMEIAKRGTPAKPRIRDNDTAAFQEECDDVLKILQTKGTRRLGQPDAPIDAHKFNATPTRRSWKQLPGYYFFASEKRAIIVVPVGISQLEEFRAFAVDDLKDSSSFVAKLKEATDTISRYLRDALSEETRRALDDYKGSAPPPDLLQALAADLGRIISGGSLIHEETRFAGVPLRPQTTYLLKKILEEHLGGQALALLNKLLIEDAYPLEVLGKQDQDIDGKQGNGVGGRVAVETLGFETTDRQIVEFLHREFEKYAAPATLPLES